MNKYQQHSTALSDFYIHKINIWEIFWLITEIIIFYCSILTHEYTTVMTARTLPTNEFLIVPTEVQIYLTVKYMNMCS